MRNSFNLRTHQRGLGLIGWLMVIGIVIVLMRCGFILGPIYLNHFKALNSIKKVVANPNTVTMGPPELRSAMQRYWDIEDIKYFEPKDIKVKKTNTGRALGIDYEVREPLYREISFLVHFVVDMPLPGGTE